MSASTASGTQPQHLRFGRVQRPSASHDDAVVAVEWSLKRNCSISPAQLLAVYASLCVISVGIATYCWVHGATLVMPFTAVELAVVGTALLVYARHAADRELITLRADRLTVQYMNGAQVEQAEFQPEWVRVGPAGDERSLIELSGQGRAIAVGRYVRPELRRALAEEFRSALRQRPAAGGRAAGIASDAA